MTGRTLGGGVFICTPIASSGPGDANQHHPPPQTLFGGYEGVCADGAQLIFVLMGNFTSKPVAHGHEGREQLVGACMGTCMDVCLVGCLRS